MNDTFESATSYTIEELELLSYYKQQMAARESRNVTPFECDDVIRYATNVSGIDVASIHRESRDAIVEMIEGVREKQQSRLTILIGEPGMGKSHIVNFFRIPENEEKYGYILVANNNNWKIEEFQRSLLSQLISSLTKTTSNGDRLLRKIQEISFQALEDMLANQRIKDVAKSKMSWIMRLIGLSPHERIKRLVCNRDNTIFRQINFRKFAKYLCENYLHTPSDAFHQYLLRVLLRYLFEEDREMVKHWLEGNEIERSFFDKLGAKNEIDRNDKIADMDLPTEIGR